ncbi:5-hydroxytryptamine receptor 1D [Myripristis murdjan]|uniref:5-hydroxytryptamine receptor 1D-like n=1 Tax=Myripristis murdjan TaxID=586833 RepID=A0A667YC00_9TELE|nr:5-hydroxytryptamine receptor 1D-like [Myripristis murdjan]
MDESDVDGVRSGLGARVGAAAANASLTDGARLVLPPRTKLLLEILMVLMCVGAVTGNILVIVIVAATKTFHSVTSVLIINLAISDLLVGGGVMPFVAVSIMNSGWVDCTDLCLYVGYTSSVYCTASVLTLAAIALDRYHSIMDCLRYSSRCTLWRTCSVVLWIWLQALATSCPPLLGWSSVSYVVPMYSCAVNWASSLSYTAFMATLSYLMPAAVILFCYVNIVKVARSHARKIHNLEDHLQQSRRSSNTVPASSSLHHQQCRSHHSTSTLLYHLTGQFLPTDRRIEGHSLHPALPDSATTQPSSCPTSRRLFSFLGQSTSQPPQHNSQQHHHYHQHGVVRLFMVMSAFFLCWTPYVAVTAVQATETALSGQSSLVPPAAVTFSYWLVLLNSDINPLLYALLSKRFRGALRGLKQKIGARLGSVVGKGGEVKAEGYDDKGSDPCTLTTTHHIPRSSSGISACDESTYCSSIFTINTNFKHHSKEHICNVCLPGSTSPSCSLWQDSGSDRMVDCLQVPSRTLEGSRLPFSALTREQQATFFYGQITVRVEHDVC